MKKLLYVLLVLFTLSTIGLQAENAFSHGAKQTFDSKYKNLFAKKGDKHKKNKWKCDCESRCQLPCLKSEKCNLSFDLLAFPIGAPLAGHFKVSIFSPKGEIVGTTTIDASTLTDFTNFTIPVSAPICAGLYTVSITNVDATTNGGPLTGDPFLMVTVTNSCNSNCIQFTFPFEEILSFPAGCSIQAVINVLPHFVHFKECEEHCECKKKKEE
jgi:hypothetical protein